MEARRKAVNPEVRERVELSFQIVDRIHEILTEKGLKQKDLALQLGKKEAEIKAFLEEAHQAGAAPSVTFEAPDDGALNVTSPEENPELDKLVKAMGI